MFVRKEVWEIILQTLAEEGIEAAAFLACSDRLQPDFLGDGYSRWVGQYGHWSCSNVDFSTHFNILD